MARAFGGEYVDDRKRFPPAQVLGVSFHVAATSANLAARWIDQLDERTNISLARVAECLIGAIFAA